MMKTGISSIGLELYGGRLPNGWLEIGLGWDPALRIHNWGNGQWDSRVGKAGAAGAPGVATANDKEVSIFDMAPCSLSLDVLQHEKIFWAPRDLFTLLLSCCRWLLWNCLKVKSHVAGLSSRGPRGETWLFIVCQNVGMSEGMRPCCQLQLLFKSETDILYLQVALRVVNVDDSLASFMRLKSVLIEGSGHSWNSLAHAAPCWDVVLISMSDVCLEFITHFSQDKNLFVGHQLLTVTIKHSGFDGVLNLTLGLGPHVMIDKLEARR